MGLLSLLWMAIVGLIVGALARYFYPGPVPMGWIGTMLLGVVGSLVGGLIGALFSRGKSGFQPAGFVLSVIGAVIALWLYLTYLR
ncbi:MAG: GlsB/YeaQ/YmgE family stress response membrane protein [Burkholderiales bacterium]|nr:GlsB/YeaQ/YmgE family stress response membrane protein [Burkholderiales bacterium]GIK87344.1 MAG: hypothetical protein BroJett026_28250 [Betaproteobacteria bacterium]